MISTYFVFVTNASLSDSGTYGCRVGGVEYSASLTVIGVCVAGVRSGCVGGVRSGCAGDVSPNSPTCTAVA